MNENEYTISTICSKVVALSISTVAKDLTSQEFLGLSMQDKIQVEESFKQGLEMMAKSLGDKTPSILDERPNHNFENIVFSIFYKLKSAYEISLVKLLEIAGTSDPTSIAPLMITAIHDQLTVYGFIQDYINSVPDLNILVFQN